MVLGITPSTKFVYSLKKPGIIPVFSMGGKLSVPHYESIFIPANTLAIDVVALPLSLYSLLPEFLFP